VPYDPGYEEAGWPADLAEARWATTLVAVELAGLLGVWLCVLFGARFTHLHGRLTIGADADGQSAIGMLASLVTIAAGLWSTVYAWQLASLSSHRVRTIARGCLAASLAGLVTFVIVAAATA
jgi:hypothetical protein